MTSNSAQRELPDGVVWESPALLVQAAPLLVGVPEAGRLLGLSPKTIRRMIAGGELQSVMVGGRRLLPVADMAAWAAALPREGVNSDAPIEVKP